MQTKVLGTFAEYLLIPSRIASLNLFEKPESVGFARAALLEPLACVSEGLRVLGEIPPGSRILVIGPGAIGLLFVAALKHQGHQDVTLAGRNPARLEVGERLGARIQRYGPELTPPKPGYDVVIECTGQVEVWERSIEFARRGGKLMLFGGCPSGSKVSFDTGRLHYDQIEVLSPFHFGTQSVLVAREYLLDPAFNVDGLVSGERGLDDAQAVFKDLEAGIGIKYVFKP